MKPIEITDEKDLHKWHSNLIFVQNRISPDLTSCDVWHLRHNVMKKITHELAGLIANKVKLVEITQSFNARTYIGKLFVFTEEELINLITEVKNENNR